MNADRLGAGQALEPSAPSRDEIGRVGRSLVRAESLRASRAADLVTARDEALSATRAKNGFLSHTSHEVCDPALAVTADRHRLRQIQVNLMSNAVKYNRGGGTITVTSRAEGAHDVSVVVTDTGPGLAPEDLQSIFTPFERLGAEQTAIEGTGIGLSLARALAEAMNGRLTVSSVQGEGSAFTISLPRARTSSAVRPRTGRRLRAMDRSAETGYRPGTGRRQAAGAARPGLASMFSTSTTIRPTSRSSPGSSRAGRTPG